MFKQAVKEQLKLRMALTGPSGSGKTYSALAIASHLGKKIAVLDSEHGSASKYADLFQFDVCELSSFHPQVYIDAIRAAGEAGYDVLIIDSLSHAWMGKDGLLEQVDRIAKRSSSGNSFTAWKDATPLQNQLIEAIISAKLHIIATMRSKTEYAMETNERGKTVPKKIGLAPVQRDGFEYEFDVMGELTQDNELIISKSRCPKLSGQVISKPGREVAEILNEWLNTGVAPAPAPKVNRDELMTAIGLELKRIGWTVAVGKKFLQDTYGKQSRMHLTDDELQSFLGYLKQSEPVPADAQAEAS